MKKKYLLLPAMVSIQILFGQINSSYKWTWIGGDNSVNNFGGYGEKGIENTTNKPGARGYFASWIDFNGNFWIFGGYGMAANGQGNLNDLWRYNVSTNKWTWMAGSNLPNQPAFQSGLGVESANNTPSSRESGSFWTSGDGKELYLFGGFSTYAGYVFHGDVWAYNVISEKWRIVKFTMVDNGGNCIGQVYGPNDQFTSGVWPVCRVGAIPASDGTKAYVFGGSRLNTFFNDFLMFSDYNTYYPNSNQWASISLLLAPPGQYSGSFPYPGGRELGNGFIYNNKFHMFGGGGYGALVNGVSNLGHLNDLWRYDGRDLLTGNTMWTWLKGDSTINGSGVYGTKGVANAANKPRARGHAMMKGTGGNQYILFGGGSSVGDLNDLWSYDAQTNNWTWLSGSSDPAVAGNYGFKGTQSNINMISARAGTAMWATGNGDIYVFGGSTPWGKKNDLWKFSPQEEPDPVNDEACGAIELSLDAPPLYGNTAFATSANDVAGVCYGATNTVWYKYTPTSTGFVQFTFGGGLSGDTLNGWMGAFVPSGGSCPTLSLADSTIPTFSACRAYYPIGGGRAPAVWSSVLTAGKTYYFRISGIFGDIGRFAVSIQSTEIINIGPGNWNDPSIWSNNRVPTIHSNITINFPVTVSANTICKSLTVKNLGQLIVQNNATLTVLRR